MRVQGVGMRVESVGVRVWGAGTRVQGAKFSVRGSTTGERGPGVFDRGSAPEVEDDGVSERLGQCRERLRVQLPTPNTENGGTGGYRVSNEVRGVEGVEGRRHDTLRPSTLNPACLGPTTNTGSGGRWHSGTLGSTPKETGSAARRSRAAAPADLFRFGDKFDLRGR